jgi:hypothetical protein
MCNAETLIDRSVVLYIQKIWSMIFLVAKYRPISLAVIRLPALINREIGILGRAKLLILTKCRQSSEEKCNLHEQGNAFAVAACRCLQERYHVIM